MRACNPLWGAVLGTPFATPPRICLLSRRLSGCLFSHLAAEPLGEIPQGFPDFPAMGSHHHLFLRTLDLENAHSGEQDVSLSAHTRERGPLIGVGVQGVLESTCLGSLWTRPALEGSTSETQEETRARQPPSPSGPQSVHRTHSPPKPLELLRCLSAWVVCVSPLHALALS